MTYTQEGWIGVNLDRTLAVYDEWRGEDHIGEPIPAMVERVKRWLADGWEVRIFTARMSKVTKTGRSVERSREIIGDWTEKHIGVRLEATCEKDYAMIELWDDRSVQVEPNTGKQIGHSVIPVPPAPIEPGCNRHIVCADANDLYRQQYKKDPPFSFHCHDDECEDCFGK